MNLSISPAVLDVAIIGAGVGGLNCARELKLADPSLSVCILEARAKIGGRSLTLRAGDVLEEAPLGKPKTQQTITFKRPPGDS